MKTVIIGAGSGFGGRLSVDIMSNESLANSTIALCDIHPGRLKKVKDYVERTIAKHNLPTKVEASTDRRELLPGADFVITSISAGGGAYYGHPYRAEVEIPRKYGIDQFVADTTGVGAVFRFLRTAPVHYQIYKDIEELAPNAYVLNHTNPMAMLTWLHHKMTSVKNVGLCHGIQATAREIGAIMGIPHEEITYKVAGINHLAWFLELHRGSEDLYPKLRKIMEDRNESPRPDLIDGELVRFEIMRQFGYFPTESNRHDSEYMPYFRRTRELRDQYKLISREIGDTPKNLREWMKDTGTEGEGSKPVGELKRSPEYTTGIMDAIVTNTPFHFNGNVMNNGLITNLPNGSCVEVPCVVNKYGIHPTYVGDLPAHLAALNRANISVQELAVNAIVERDKEAAFYAVALSPITSAVLSLPEIRKMFDELWEAEKDLLLWFDPSHKGPVPEFCAE